MQAKLVLFKDGQRKDFDLRAGKTTVGRQEGVGLRIPHPDVSRVHCELTCSDAGVTLRDNGSSNGTYVNDRRVTEATLKPGDIIKLGPFLFTAQINGRPTEIVPPEEIDALMGDDDSGEIPELSLGDPKPAGKAAPGKPAPGKAAPGKPAAGSASPGKKSAAEEEDPLDVLEALDLDDFDDDFGSGPGKK